MSNRPLARMVLVGLLALPAFGHVVVSLAPGYASFIVVGGSMEPTIDRGSLVYVQETNAYELGDVITFEKDGRVFTHRIVAETDDGFVTRGDGNDASDGWSVAEAEIIGEVVVIVPYYGAFLGFAGTTVGYLIAVFVPSVVLIGLELRELGEELR